MQRRLTQCLFALSLSWLAGAGCDTAPRSTQPPPAPAKAPARARADEPPRPVATTPVVPMVQPERPAEAMAKTADGAASGAPGGVLHSNVGGMPTTEGLADERESDGKMGKADKVEVDRKGKNKSGLEAIMMDE